MSILDEIWRGSFCPAEKSFYEIPDYAHVAKELSQQESDLLQTLESEQQGHLEKLMELNNQLCEIDRREMFFYGFRVAISLLREGLPVPETGKL